MEFLYVLLGLASLALAGNFLVKGAVNLANRLGVSPLIIGLTVVSFGTSAPELLIVLSALDDNAAGLAVGNVVGSNTANILLVLGLPALVMGLHTSQTNTRSSYIWMLAAVGLFITLAFFGPFTWWYGIILLGFLAYVLWLQARNDKGEAAQGMQDAPQYSLLKTGIYIAIGLIGLPLGADILVDGAVVIAKGFGVSDGAIGLTLVAIGTSLPELAATTIATYRRQSAVALGNVIGSNMFNMLAIIGIAAFFDDIPVAKEFLRFDLWCMLAASLLLVPFVFFKLDINRLWGAVFVSLYAVYIFAVLG